MDKSVSECEQTPCPCHPEPKDRYIQADTASKTSKRTYYTLSMWTLNSCLLAKTLRLHCMLLKIYLCSYCIFWAFWTRFDRQCFSCSIIEWLFWLYNNLALHCQFCQQHKNICSLVCTNLVINNEYKVTETAVKVKEIMSKH